MPISPLIALITCGGSPRKPRTEPVEGSGPDFRIVTNGRRFRVQKRTSKRPDVWIDVGELVYPGSFLADLRHSKGHDIFDFRPFETRWLWRAKRRLRREMKAVEQAAQAEAPWRVVITED